MRNLLRRDNIGSETNFNTAETNKPTGAKMVFGANAGLGILPNLR